jgi:hypothetical protein
LDNGKTVLLVIGRMMQNKGTGEILEAAEKLKETHDDLIIRFIGFPMMIGNR